MYREYAIIVAGGKGLRMGAGLPKQFLPVNGLPVLMHTLKQFRAYSDTLQLILVLPAAQQEYWRSLCCQYGFDVAHTVADGGETRFHSVRNGLARIPDDEEGTVAVHDGVRPFVSAEVIASCFHTARLSGTAVPVVPVVETLRHINRTDNSSTTVSRDDYRLVQTPQTFSIQLLKKAYAQTYDTGFTDDASVVERLGHGIELVEGNRENIKLTTPFDLTVAHALTATGQEQENRPI